LRVKELGRYMSFIAFYYGAAGVFTSGWRLPILGWPVFRRSKEIAMTLELHQLVAMEEP